MKNETALFTVTQGEFEKNKILDYVNILPAERITENYYKEINELCFREGLLSYI